MVNKYFLYARKSTEEDDQQIMSIEAQLFELREYARKENLEIIEEFTESKSAKTPGREKFNELMTKIEAMDGVGILTWHPDRLARNSVDGGKIIYLVDTKKIVALKFPTFWFEPTPQGKFMLQVAFGQSKYYSDNLVENINRGFRQKIRRGEWPTLAPFGYVNNQKTRTIEPHPFLAKVVVKAFEQFATGNYSYESLALYLVELGVETKNRTPLSKHSISKMLSNKTYLGFTRHRGEYFEGSFPPIVSPALFESVQAVLKRKTKKRKNKAQNDFPLTGLMSCGECGCAITACCVTGKSGGIYRYYRCTKKKGKCSQGTLQEKHLVEQIKNRLSTILIPDQWTDKMFEQVSAWEKDDTETTKIHKANLKTRIEETENTLNKLIGAYLAEDIPKENYLLKKEELLTRKQILAQNLKDSRGGGQSWIKPLKEWILSTKKATFVASSGNLSDLKQIVLQVGLNPQFVDKTVQFRFRSPWSSILETLGETAIQDIQTDEKNSSEIKKIKESSLWWRWRELNSRPKLVHLSIIHKISSFSSEDDTDSLTTNN